MPSPAAPAPTQTAPTPPPPPAAAEPPTAPTPAPPVGPPGDQYYTEAPPPAGAAAAAEPAPAPFEPPLPGRPPFEPPPPPATRHLAPKTALWVGARVGWFFPFGNVWADARTVSQAEQSYFVLEGRPWRDYASSGPLLEIDLGVRLSRAYSVFALWERAQLGSGSTESELERGGEQDGAESDFWGVGLRANSDPNRVGFVTEVSIGYRRARTFFTNDTEYQFTEAPFEARLGLGAEVRLSPFASISPLLTVGVGGFGSARAVDADNRARSLTGPLDEVDGHAWLTLQVGGHFDLLRSAN